MGDIPIWAVGRDQGFILITAGHCLNSRRRTLKCILAAGGSVKLAASAFRRCEYAAVRAWRRGAGHQNALSIERA